MGATNDSTKCRCGHPSQSHDYGNGACGRMFCYCTRFKPPFSRPVAPGLQAVFDEIAPSELLWMIDWLSHEPCPSGCGCRTDDDPDRRDCACDGPCCMADDWPVRLADLPPIITRCLDLMKSSDATA